VSVVTGQVVSETKMLAARRFRSEMTPEESVLWSQLRGSRLHRLHFRRQQVIDGFIVDFYCHAARLVVEVDGADHWSGESYDVERDRIIVARGQRILRISNDDVNKNLSAVLESIRKAATKPLEPAAPNP
jgi:very-short-patch-repair endonuclease